MNNYYSIPNKYNRFLITILSIAPFLAFITYDFLDIDFNRIMQLLSYIGVFLVIIFRKSENPIKFPRYLLFYLLFILYVFFSAFYQLDRDFKITYLFSNKLIGAFNFMFIIENLPISKKYYKFLIKVSTRILIMAVLVIIIQQAINKNFFMRTDLVEKGATMSDNSDRLHSIYSWIGSFSNGLSFVPLFILIVGHLYKQKKKIFIWLLIGVLYAVLTKARWIMLNTLLVFLLLFINQKNKVNKFFKFLVIVPIIVFSFSITLSAVGIDIEGIVNERILEKNKKNLSQKSASTRLLAFKAFDEFFWKQPFFGKGSIKYGMGGEGKQDYELKKFLRGRSSQIHVGYLSVLYMYGLVGGIFFIGFLYLILKKLRNDARHTGMWGPFLGILGLAVANLTLVTFSFFEMGLLIALVVNNYYVKNKNVRININA